MNNERTFYLREFKNGDFMLWSVCSQCWNTFTVTIRDENEVYAVIKKATHDTNLQKLSQDAKKYKGGDALRVEIVFDSEEVDIQESIVSGGVVDSHSNTIGYSYTYCLEDAHDEDFNDAYISIIAWRKMG